MPFLRVWPARAPVQRPTAASSEHSRGRLSALGHVLAAETHGPAGRIRRGLGRVVAHPPNRDATVREAPGARRSGPSVEGSDLPRTPSATAGKTRTDSRPAHTNAAASVPDSRPVTVPIWATVTRNGREVACSRPAAIA